MPTYAPVPAFAERRPYPRALVVIAAAHAAAIAAVMLVKMDLPRQLLDPPTKVELIPIPKEPPPSPPEPKPAPEPGRSVIDRPAAVVPIPAPSTPNIDASATPLADPGVIIGTSPRPEPAIAIQPRVLPVRTGPRFDTPDSRLRPPYPQSKINSGEEAALRLRLSIDERGRVTGVDPVGPADPAFLRAARRHLIANWHYRPATEGGRAVASTTVITLQFQLDD